MKHSIPGTWLDRAASRLCSATTLDRVVRPILADLQAEHGLALARGRRWTARWMLARGYAGFWLAMGLHLGHESRRRVREAVVASTDADRDVVRRTVRGGLAAAAAMTALLSLDAAGSLARLGIDDALRFLRLVVLLLPSVLGVTVPLGLFLGVLLAGARPHGEPRPALGPILGLATVVAIAVFIGGALVMPEANQRFRLAAFEQVTGQASAGLARGGRELTLPDLAAAIARSKREGRRQEAAGLEVEWHKKIALPAASVALALVGAAAAPRTRIRAVALFLAVAWSYFAILRLGEPLARRGSLSPPVAMWFGNVLLAALAGLLLWRGRLSAGETLGPASGSGSAPGT